jgi:indole-3-glycerol phosphate synthase
VQASRTWQPPGGTLGKILEETRRTLPSLEGGPRQPTPEGAGRPTSFRAALQRSDVAIIGEIKRRSPSKGELDAGIDAAKRAVEFERGGAAAISVLTESTFFGGTLADLRDTRSAVRVPILRKDFHIHEMQLVQSRDAGASAVLLIARALAPDELPRLVDGARALGLETLVEVRSEEELERAVEARAEVIGVNSRNLETLEVDERVPERLMPRVPANIVRVWESGVRTVSDVQRAADAGADAVLVGSALSTSPDPVSLLRSLRGVPRRTS